MRLAPILVAAASLLAGDVAIDLARGTVVVAEARAGIEVGDVLEAIQDVSLDEAVIRKGSTVSVSRKSSAGGRVFLDVALTDGHVVRSVPMSEIQKSFRRVPG